MVRKPTYEELEQRVKELEKETFEHKRAEEASRESEGLFRTIVETAPSLLIICDANGNNIYVYMSVLTVKRFLATFKKSYRLNRYGGYMRMIRQGRSISMIAHSARVWEVGTSNTKQSKRMENCCMLRAPGSRSEMRKANSRALFSRQLTLLSVNWQRRKRANLKPNSIRLRGWSPLARWLAALPMTSIMCSGAFRGMLP